MSMVIINSRKKQVSFWVFFFDLDLNKTTKEKAYDSARLTSNSADAALAKAKLEEEKKKAQVHLCLI